MGATKLIPYYTFEDYLRWEGRWELIEGIPFAMSPMANPKHQKIASKLNILLGNLLDKSNCNCQVYQPIDVKIKEDTVVNPDLLIVCHEIEGQFLDRPFPMAVEILSPSTKVKDQVSKYKLYEEFGVKYYVMLDPDDKSVKVFVLNTEGKYKEQKEWNFTIDEGCDIEVDFRVVF